MTPVQLAEAAIAADRAHADPAIWIVRLTDATILAAARALEAEGPRDRPLWGVPFAIKDNIDVAGLTTTCACPGFAYTPDSDAPAVRRLLDAGALLIGKTNLDQFATGLVGTRSPYGVPRNVFDPTLVPGGSSSGSACAVAAGIVVFALGTDTAGSGRVPAAFGNIIGLKPTVGSVSARGMVPACRSIDTISVFARSVDEALMVQRVIAGYDAKDPYSRPAPFPHLRRGATPQRFDAGRVSGHAPFPASSERDAGQHAEVPDGDPGAAAGSVPATPAGLIGPGSIGPGVIDPGAIDPGPIGPGAIDLGVIDPAIPGSALAPDDGLPPGAGTISGTGVVQAAAPTSAPDASSDTHPSSDAALGPVAAVTSATASMRIALADVAALCEPDIAAAFQQAGTFLNAVPVDIGLFLKIAHLLYEGPWVAERSAALRPLIDRTPDILYPATRSILELGLERRTVDAFDAFHLLQQARREAALLFADYDALLVPAAPFCPSLAAVDADPLGPNRRLGTFTNFANLCDMAGFAIPIGFTSNTIGTDGTPISDTRIGPNPTGTIRTGSIPTGSIPTGPIAARDIPTRDIPIGAIPTDDAPIGNTPIGAVLLGPAWSEGRLAPLADALHRHFATTVGATGQALPQASEPDALSADETALFCIGAHMAGLPLNRQITALGGRFLRAANTRPQYRLFALGNRPGMIRAPEDGAAIAGEVWALPTAAIGPLLAQVPPPLGFGTVLLDDGPCLGFLAESAGVGAAPDITHLGGWRAWLRTQSKD